MNYRRFKFASDCPRSTLRTFDALRFRLLKELPGAKERFQDFAAVYSFENRNFFLVRFARGDLNVFFLDVPDPEGILTKFDGIGYSKFFRIRRVEDVQVCYEFARKSFLKAGGKLPETDEPIGGSTTTSPPAMARIIAFPEIEQRPETGNAGAYDVDSPVSHHLLEEKPTEFVRPEPYPHREFPLSPELRRQSEKKPVLDFLRECEKAGPLGNLTDLLGPDTLVYFVNFSHHYYLYYNNRIFRVVYLMLDDQGNASYKFVEKVQDLAFEKNIIRETGTILSLNKHLRTLNYFVYGYV